MKNQNSQRVVYQLLGLPAGVFGESYVVVTAFENSPGYFGSEQFILTQRPTERMKMDAFTVNGRSFPEELCKVDLGFVLEEGKTHAEYLVSVLLEDRAEELERPELSLSRFELCSRPVSFVGCKMRRRFVNQFKEMREATECNEFAYYLSLLDQVPTFR